MGQKLEKKTAVTLMCPNLRCRKILMVPASMRGSRVRCSYCGFLLVVPVHSNSFEAKAARAKEQA
jgi:DNA-directed RNA polymerase subunit RPC12/RpoP